MQKSLNSLRVKLTGFVCLCLFVFNCHAQSHKIDLAYLAQRDSLVASTSTNSKVSTKRKFNPITLFLGGSLKFYQNTISPQISANCLFEVSCSRFSQGAIQEFGVLKGIALTADRLARCNRISATTINPVRITEQGKVIDDPKMYKIKE